MIKGKKNYLFFRHSWPLGVTKRGTENGTEGNGKRNERENKQCDIHILAYYIFTHFL